MVDLQRNNEYNSIKDVIFDPNSYEMDEKEIKITWKHILSILLVKEMETRANYAWS